MQYQEMRARLERMLLALALVLGAIAGDADAIPTQPDRRGSVQQLGLAERIVADGGSATPAAIWNKIGKTDKVGSSTGFDGSPIPDPARAPADFLSLPAGDATNLPVGMLFTLQGVIIDPNTGANKPVSLTNTVIVTVE